MSRKKIAYSLLAMLVGGTLLVGNMPIKNDTPAKERQYIEAVYHKDDLTDDDEFVILNDGTIYPVRNNIELSNVEDVLYELHVVEIENTSSRPKNVFEFWKQKITKTDGEHYDRERFVIKKSAASKEVDDDEKETD